MLQRLFAALGLSLLLLLCMCQLTASFPQYPLSPTLNWEQVILSRNGPSTSTTPRPTRWTTTTLRSFGGDRLTGTGKASYEEAVIARDGSRDQRRRQQQEPHLEQ